MIGALAFIAMSWIFTIFCAWVSDSEPPNTVKSLANTKVLRPLTVPQPVTTPSPGTLVFSIPNSTERCSTNMSNSSNEPLSSNSSMRSRAVSLPRACCASMRFSPPPSLAPARRSSRVSRMSFMGVSCQIYVGSNTAFSQRETAFRHLAPRPGARYIRCHNGGDGHRIRDQRAAGPFDRDDLAGAHRHRPRARLRAEMQHRFRLHPSRPRRQEHGQDGRGQGGLTLPISRRP